MSQCSNNFVKHKLFSATNAYFNQYSPINIRFKISDEHLSEICYKYQDLIFLSLFINQCYRPFYNGRASFFWHSFI